jgi:hypothetical protein
MVGRRTAAEHQIVQLNQLRQATWKLGVGRRNRNQQQDSTRKKASRYRKAFFVNGNLANYLKEIS